MEIKDYIAAFAAVISLVSIYMSWSNASAQGQLTERLKAHDDDVDRKKLVITLWDKIVNLWEIHPDAQGDYDEHQVFETINTLELIASCWANRIVDKRMISIVAAKSYSLRVREITGISRPLQHLRRTGPELLQERPLISKVAREMETMLEKGST